jgi:hypothetical protein
MPLTPIFGKSAYTAAELEELINAKKHNLDSMENSYALYAITINKKDPSWKGDWDNLKARWESAKTKAESKLFWAKAQILTPNNMIPADEEYQGILGALRQVPNKIMKGDLFDLSGRLTRAGAPPDLSGTPQGSQYSDMSFNVFSTLNTVRTAIDESPLGAVVHEILPKEWVAQDQAGEKADPLAHPLDHSTFWIFGILGAFIAYFLAKNVAAPVARSYLAPMGGFAGATRAATERAQDALARRLDIQPPSRSSERQEIVLDNKIDHL